MSADRLWLHLTVLKDLELWDEVDALLENKYGKIICSSSLVCDEVRREIAHTRGQWVEEGTRAEAQILEHRYALT